MKKIYKLIVIFSLLKLSVCISQNTNFDRYKSDTSVSKYYNSFEIFSLNIKKINQTIKKNKNAKSTVVFDFENKKYELFLEQNYLAGGGKIPFKINFKDSTKTYFISDSEIPIYKGYFKNKENEVRLLISDQLISGTIQDGNKLLNVTNANKYNKSIPDSIFILGEIKTQIALGSNCDLSATEKIKQRIDETILNQLNKFRIESIPLNSISGYTLELEIATDTDFEFYKLFDNLTNCGNYIADVLNQAEGLYYNTFKISFKWVNANYSVSSFQPYTSIVRTSGFSFDANTNCNHTGGLLRQLKDNYVLNGTNLQRDVVYLFTGKTVSGVSGGGTAWCYGKICDNNQSYAVGWSNGKDSFFDMKMVAHELGHLFNSYHDTDYSGNTENCEFTNLSRPLMCPTTFNTTSANFSNKTISEIRNYVHSISLPISGCLTYRDCYNTYSNLSGNIIGYTSFQAFTSISSSQTVSSGATLRLGANQQIRLLPGFRANQGSNFRAFNNNCNSQQTSSPRIEALDVSINKENVLTSNLKNNFVIYPNPSTDFFKIDYVSREKSASHFTIIDDFGTIIDDFQKYNEIEGKYSFHYTRDLPSGLYLVKFEQETDIVTQKIIIQK